MICDRPISLGQLFVRLVPILGTALSGISLEFLTLNRNGSLMVSLPPSPPLPQKAQQENSQLVRFQFTYGAIVLCEAEVGNPLGPVSV